MTVDRPATGGTDSDEQPTADACVRIILVPAPTWPGGSQRADGSRDYPAMTGAAAVGMLASGIRRLLGAGRTRIRRAGP